MKGIIGLDIDGTITAELNTMPKDVAVYLKSLSEEGWKLIFITGRSFQWSHKVLRLLDFPYYAAVQNGAIIVEMPSKRIISKKYLDKRIFPTMENICEDEPTDFVIYAGMEHEDVCFYRPKYFSDKLLAYLERRKEALKEDWRPLETYEDLKIEEFPSIKSFGLLQSAQRIAGKIEKQLTLHVPLIKDPFSEEYFVVQATHPAVSKGQALKDFGALFHNKGIVIAAGDDYNDISMLKIADIKVVMSTAPKEILALADIVAPPAEDMGIIEGLEEAIKTKKG